MTVAFFVSAHGFGHAARAAAVMTAIRRREPDVGLEVFTRIPEWFFSEALSAPVFYHSITTDVGFVQKDPFVADIPETLDRLESFLPFSKPLVRELAANLTARKCRAVVCDISPLGIAVARAAGVPSILMENFTWDHLYSSYCDAYPAFEPFMKMLATWFSAVDVHIQTEPVCRLQPGRRLLHPISRPPSKRRTPSERPLAFPTTGRWFWLPWAAWRPAAGLRITSKRCLGRCLCCPMMFPKCQ